MPDYRKFMLPHCLMADQLTWSLQVGLCSASAAGFAIQYLCAFNPGPQVAIARFLSLDTSITDASPGPAGPPPGPSVPISISWVLSLVVSLGTVVVGITCLQWIREYLSDSRLGPKEGLAFRQMRYDGLMFWKVPFIISILPTLLLFSILLFFHGLMLFLYSLNKVVAIVIAAPVGIVWVFMTFATMLPALQCIFMSEERVRGHQCPYKSPQARLFAWFAFWFSVLVIRMLRGLGWKAEFLQKKQTFLENLIEGGLDWVSFDTTWQHERLMVPSDKSQEREGKDIAQAMAWLSRTGTHSVQGIHALYSSLRDVHPATALETIRKLVPGDYISDFSLQCGHDHRHDVVLKDLIGAVLLGYSVRNNHQLQRPFFDHRVELFIRIANSLVVGILGEELRDTRALVEKYFTPPFTGAVTIISPFSKDQDYAEVPNGVPLNTSRLEHRKLTRILGYKHQLLITFNAHLKASTAALRPLPWALWDIVRPMVAQIVKGYPSPASDKYLQTELHIVNKELEAYFRHISMAVKQGESWELVRSARMSLIEYRDQFFTQGVVVQSIERRFPDFWEALKSLESAVIEASAPSPSRFSTTSRSETLVARVY